MRTPFALPAELAGAGALVVTIPVEVVRASNENLCSVPLIAPASLCQALSREQAVEQLLFSGAVLGGVFVAEAF
jgi:hypothetical protein